MSRTSSRQRRRFSPEQKVAILREHLLEGRPISAVCDRHGVHPTLFYRWQKEFFEGGHVVFEQERRNSPMRKAEKKIARLEQKLRQKDEVLAELMSEYIAVKKSLGDD